MEELDFFFFFFWWGVGGGGWGERFHGDGVEKGGNK